MSWRTVVIASRCKLDYSMGYMVVRAEETKRVFMEEIAMLILENPAVSMTGCLLNELTKHKIRIIFCDERRSPYGELQPYNGSHDSSYKIKIQTHWTDEQKQTVWTEIVTEKIRNQARLLSELDHNVEAELLTEYISQIQFADETNREGHAAKVYFNALFGKDFSRGQENYINAALNYGYGLILSAFNREVTANGYLPNIGIFHDNMFNHYNLSCDLMEPFRVVIDRAVVAMKPDKFEKEEKYELVSVLNDTVNIADSSQTLINAVRIYTRSVFDAINEYDVSEIKFIKI